MMLSVVMSVHSEAKMLPRTLPSVKAITNFYRLVAELAT